MGTGYWSRRCIIAVVLACVFGAGSAAAFAQGNLEKVRLGLAQSAVSAIVINWVVPRYLGYYKEEGLEVEIIPLGTNAAVMASLEQKRLEFGVGVPSFQLPLMAKGAKLPMVNFYEYTYPFKWALAVRPDATVKSITELRGKTIGVSAFGVTDYPVGKAVFRLANVDPEKDVKWLAVGEGLSAGQALVKGDIAALFNFDTNFGRIESAGMKMKYLDLPRNVPKVGGLYIAASRETIEKRRAAAVGIGRAIAKASLFILENPEAAAYIFLQLYPEGAPRAASLQEQVKAVMVPITKRMPLYRHYDKSVTNFGQILPSEWNDEVEFLDLTGKIKDVQQLYTNELIAEINKFDRNKVIAEARNFKVPYK